jgi:hypothetical protein
MNQRGRKTECMLLPTLFHDQSVMVSGCITAYRNAKEEKEHNYECAVIMVMFTEVDGAVTLNLPFLFHFSFV